MPTFLAEFVLFSWLFPLFYEYTGTLFSKINNLTKIISPVPPNWSLQNLHKICDTVKIAYKQNFFGNIC